MTTPITEIVTPSAGESVNEATVSCVFVVTGSLVHVDEPIMELETEKANLPVYATAEGVAEILVHEGDVVTPQQVLVRIDTSGKAPHSEGQASTSPPPPA
ncbi:MAG: hypothetical protein HQL31_06600, partial [Planctomycetes bacterium]|nr:hypothetical protein [Planctomycetota bacterium]